MVAALVAENAGDVEAVVGPGEGGVAGSSTLFRLWAPCRGSLL